MSSQGAFAFVLHSHIPYVRQAGMWPHGEEWLHEAQAETYIPLIDALNRLTGEGRRVRITLTLTPVLLEQLADPDVRSHFKAYLADRRTAAEEDRLRFEREGQPHLANLAQAYRERYRSVLRSYEETYSGDLVGAFRDLQERGVLDVATSAATHAYLPLLANDASIHLQLAAAAQTHERHLGRRPRAIWLPECAYRPGYYTEAGALRPGLERLLEVHGLALFFAETHMIEGGAPVGMAAGQGFGPYGSIDRDYVIPTGGVLESHRASTLRPYWVGESRVAVIGRDNPTGMQVWSSEHGYPGDFDYREFHKKDSHSGLQYWRVSGKDIDLGMKDGYAPAQAARRVESHAGHFVSLVARRLEEGRGQGFDFPLVSSHYDTELFGHWWYEGVSWLEQTLRRLASNPQIELTTPLDYLDQHPPTASLHVPEGSWGAGGGHHVWDNESNHWMWDEIHRCEAKYQQVAGTPERAPQLPALKQLARELLLMQASDWPFLVTTGQAPVYAEERFRQHVQRFDQLAGQLSEGTVDNEFLAAIWESDKVFPDIDPSWFAE